MKIEVWSDFVCPFCYIGKRRLEQALNQFPHKDEVEVTYRSFELDPNIITDDSINIHEGLAKKYGMSVEQAKQTNQNIIDQAKTVGLNYNFDAMSPTNTFKAHRLAKYAETKGKLAEMTERLLRAHFTESEKIDHQETLLRLASEVGLNLDEVKDVLEGEQFANEVRADEQEAYGIGVRGVPFFVINQKYAISGAQPLELFINALQQVWEEENQTS